MIGLNTQRVLRQRLDVTSNNLANMNTTSFKAEKVLAQTHNNNAIKTVEQTGDIQFAHTFAVQRNMGAGSLERTENPMDLAITQPNAFFAVQTPDGETYTRDGRFSLDDLSRLVTRDGFTVLDADGAEIVFDPDGDAPTISDTGVIRQGDLEIAQLKLVEFETPEILEKFGNNLWRPTTEEPQPSEAPLVKQGHLEQSNVNAIQELTTMIQISKAYESASRIIKDADQLRERSIERLGRAT